MQVPPFPKRIEIELSSSCNLRCIYCPRQFVDNLHGFIDPVMLKKLIDELAPHPETILVLHRRGESLLHPNFIEIMEYIRGKFNTVQLATNATMLNEKNINAIIDTVTFLSFSIDSPTLYEKTRPPAKYREVENNIKRFLRINRKKNNPVETQVSMVKTGITPEEETLIFEKIWIDKVDRVRIYEEHSTDGNFGSLTNKRPNRKPCVMPFYEMLIYYDGKIGRCNHDWDGEPIGDISQSSIAETWHSASLNDLRRQHESLQISDPVCKNCDCWYAEEGLQGTGKVLKK